MPRIERIIETAYGRSRYIVPADADPGKPTALLVHGSGGNADVWEPMLDLFREVNPVAIDMPGHAPSSGALLQSMQECSAFIEAVRVALNVPRVVVIGQSLGGAIAQQYAHEHAATCAAIVIANSAADFSISDERLRAVEQEWDVTLPAYARGQLSARAGAELHAAATRMVAARVPATFVNDLKLCNSFSSRAWADRLRVPALIIAGHDDTLTVPARSFALLDLMKHAEMVMFSPCGHCTMLEQPLRFATEVDLFVTQSL